MRAAVVQTPEAAAAVNFNRKISIWIKLWAISLATCLKRSSVQMATLTDAIMMRCRNKKKLWETWRRCNKNNNSSKEPKYWERLKPQTFQSSGEDVPSLTALLLYAEANRIQKWRRSLWSRNRTRFPLRCRDWGKSWRGRTWWQGFDTFSCHSPF